LTEETKSRIRFWNDSTISIVQVNRTCERCNEINCRERIADPVIEKKKKALRDIEQKLLELNIKD
jgi:hypothetical protein